jgi:type I restriction enzyme, S subunit
VISNPRPYPAYKDSNISWLPCVPSHWNSYRLKRLAADKPYAIVDGPFGTQLKASEYTTSGVPLIRIKNLSYEGQFLRKGLTFISESKWRELRRSAAIGGDIVIAKTGATIGKTAIVPNDMARALIASSCIKLSPDQARLVPSFGKYLISSADFQREIMLASGGSTRDTINIDPFSNIVVPLPPLFEQNTIVRFLDHVDLRIRRYIAAKRKLIGLLEEQKQAIIQQAVTRGLDPNVAMKSVGVEWLGEVPTHWRIDTLKWVAKLHRGYDLSDDLRVAGGYPVVSSGGIIGTHNVSMAKGPGVVTGRYGSTGAFFYIESDFWPHNTALYVSDFYGNSVRFVFYLLQILAFGAHSGKAAVPGIDRKDVHKIQVAVPPKGEQEEITEWLDTELEQLTNAVSRIRQHIELIREYRTRLIADVVTGQVDVREPAATLAELEVDELVAEEPTADEGEGDDGGVAMGDEDTMTASEAEE